jgi:hypothetical protein
MFTKLCHYAIIIGFIGALPATLENAGATDVKLCLSYEPGVVSLKGKLHWLGTHWVINLSDPICIYPIRNNVMSYPRIDKVSAVLVMLRKGDQPEQYNDFSDKIVLATGTMYHENVEGGEGNIVIRVSEIALVKEGAENGGK